MWCRFRRRSYRVRLRRGGCFQTDVSFGCVDGIDDEVAVALLEGNTDFRSRSEDALPCQLRLMDRAFAGFENDLLIRCQRDAGDIVCRFEADFIARLESAVPPLCCLR